MSFDDLYKLDSAAQRAYCAAEVKRPGPFEGARIYAPYFWSLVLEGGGDEERVLSGGTHVDIFKMGSGERITFPELDDVKYVAVWIDDAGFVYARPFATRETLDAWLAEQGDYQADGDDDLGPGETP